MPLPGDSAAGGAVTVRLVPLGGSDPEAPDPGDAVSSGPGDSDPSPTAMHTTIGGACALYMGFTTFSPVGTGCARTCAASTRAAWLDVDVPAGSRAAWLDVDAPIVAPGGAALSSACLEVCGADTTKARELLPLGDMLPPLAPPAPGASSARFAFPVTLQTGPRAGLATRLSRSTSTSRSVSSRRHCVIASVGGA